MQRGRRSWRFTHLIDSITYPGAADDRDMVYGLLGLTEYSKKDVTLPESLTPDYSFDPYLLYRWDAFQSIKENRNLRVLCKAGLHDRAVDKSKFCKLEIPSWTPRLDTEGKNLSSTPFSTQQEYSVAQGGFIETKLCICYHASAWQPAKTILSDDLDTLTLSGLHLDRAKVALPTVKYNKTEGINHGIAGFLDFWEAVLKYESLNDSSPDEVLQDFALRIFSVSFIFKNNHRFYQSLSVLDQHGMKRCWRILLSNYADNASRVGAMAKIERYHSFSTGGDVPRLMSLHFNKTPFITIRGYFGLGQAGTCEGDRILVLFGGHHPFLLEQCGSECHLVGEAVVREYHEWPSSRRMEEGQD